MGLFNKKNKKNIEEKEERRTFEEFIDQELTPLFTTMCIVDMADDIGIEPYEYNDASSQGSNRHTDKINLEVKNLITQIENMVEDEEFRKKLIHKIIFIKDYGTFQQDKENFNGTFNTSNNSYHFNVTIKENYISFSFKNINNEKELKGEYKKTPNGISSIQYNDTKKRIYHLEGKDSFDVKTVKTIHVFDENGYQNFEYSYEVNDNYSIDLSTGEKTLNDPSPFENYTEKFYKWRAPQDTIILKQKKQYIYEDGKDCIHNADNFLIGKNVSPEDKRLPFGGNFVWFDKELYQNYINNGKTSVDEIWQHRGKTYQKKSSTH